jgi:hypothetical protein
MASDADFPEELGALIQECVPNLEAAETLLLLFHQRDRQWTIADVIAGLHPTVTTDGAVRKYLETFAGRGLVARKADDAWQYEPASQQLDELVQALDRAHKRRPVTLVRLIYNLKIRSFADAFRLRKD